MAGKLVILYSGMVPRTHAEISARSVLSDLLNSGRDRHLTRKLGDICIDTKSPEDVGDGFVASVYNVVDKFEADLLVCVGNEFYDVFVDGDHFAWDTLYYGVGQGEKLVPPYGQRPARDKMMHSLLRILDPNSTQHLTKHQRPSCIAWELREYAPCI